MLIAQEILVNIIYLRIVCPLDLSSLDLGHAVGHPLLKRFLTGSTSDKNRSLGAFDKSLPWSREAKHFQEFVQAGQTFVRVTKQ
jgi:hypothetical protein